MYKQMQLTFQSKYKSINYSVAQRNAHICRFGAGCVCTQSVPLLGQTKVFSEKENLLYCILCKVSLLVSCLGFSASPCSGGLGYINSFLASHIGSLNL